MQVKMLAHYHGRLSGDVHFQAGEVYDVDAKSGAELVKRGKAVEEKAAAKVVKKPTKALGTKPLK